MPVRLIQSAILLLCASAIPAVAELAESDWPHYHGDPTGSHYSQLGQITRENVASLKVAWTYNSLGAQTESQSGRRRPPRTQCNPIIIAGVLYGASPDGYFFAVHAATGEEKWRFLPSEDTSGRTRGVTYWRDGDESRLFVAKSSWLYALDPATGEKVASFGSNGIVDLREGLGRDPETLMFDATSPGIIFNDLYIVGGFVSENLGAAPGDIRAYDVRTGEVVWSFHTIPSPGEFGADTWPANAREFAGAANAWAGFSLDVERGMVFAPTGSAAYDFYGGDRLGKNLFANCVIALDAATGERIWHFQTVHHDLWDKDLPAPPNIVTVTHNGRRIDAVAQITKSGFVFVLDRETGEPLFPVEEVPVAPSEMDGEQAWPTQPVPTKPPPFLRTFLSKDDITDISPEANAYINHILTSYRNAEMFTPFSEQPTVLLPGILGGAELGGAAYDPQSATIYVNSSDLPYVITLVKLDNSENLTPFQKGRNVFAQHCSSCHGMDRKGGITHMGFTPPLLGIHERMTRAGVEQIIREGRGQMQGVRNAYRDPENLELLMTFLMDPRTDIDQDELANPTHFIYADMGHQRFEDQEGYPAIKPPWGTLNAIDLNEGTIKWQVVLGEYKELTARGIPKTGTANKGGPILTATGLLFIAATDDETFRAFDQITGETLWEAALPGSGQATPSTYSVDGRQYVVIACAGGSYVSYALPE